MRTFYREMRSFRKTYDLVRWFSGSFGALNENQEGYAYMHATIGQVAIPAVLILFLVYRRIRKTVGYQPFKPRRLQVRIGVFSVLALMLLLLGFLHPIVWVGDAAGVAAGLVLARFAIRHNEFDSRENGLYYRTNTAIQAIVVALLLGRLAYRFAFAGPTAAQTAATTAGEQIQMQRIYGSDPWTSGIFFVLVTFYIVYFTYVLRHGKERLSA